MLPTLHLHLRVQALLSTNPLQRLQHARVHALQAAEVEVGILTGHQAQKLVGILLNAVLHHVRAHTYAAHWCTEVRDAHSLSSFQRLLAIYLQGGHALPFLTYKSWVR